jgi:hypothetical protein
VPFANGPQYYVHPYPSEGRAWTQEFISPGATKGSILQCRLGAACPPLPPACADPQSTCSGAYYVRGQLVYIRRQRWT